MFAWSPKRSVALAAAALALSGCVAAVPTESSLTVIPGQGKTEADLRADDVICRSASNATGAPAGTAGQLVTSASAATAVSADQYYACMAARGETVIEQRTAVVPAYAGYAYPAYPAYGYGVPYAGYPYGYGGYGYGYPFYGPYYGPYAGFGVGFGFGRFYGGRGYYGGFHRGFGYGGYRGGYGGFRGGYGGYHGGGGFRGGGHR